MITKEDVLSLGFELKYEEIKSYSHWCEFKKGDLEIYHQFKEVNWNNPINHFNFRGKHNTNFKMYLENKEELEHILDRLYGINTK